VRDAVKKPLPKEAPKPGKFKLAEADNAEAKQEAKAEAAPAAEANAAPEQKEGA